MSGRGYIAVTPEERCEMCQKIAELRPYGPRGEKVCYDCGMKDPKAVDRGIAKHIFGEESA